VLIRSHASGDAIHDDPDSPGIFRIHSD